MDGQIQDPAELARVEGAIGRLHTFAILQDQGAVIDQTSGLTTDDLNVLLSVLEQAWATAQRASMS